MALLPLRQLTGRFPLLGLSLGLFLLAAPARAQEDDDGDFDFTDVEDDEDEEEEEKKDDEGEAGTPLPESDDDLGFDTSPTTVPDDDFDEDPLDLDEEPGVALPEQGGDTAAIYREQQEEVEGLGPEEEAIEWERYLRKYPNSQFRSRIEARIEKLTDTMYAGSIQTREAQVEAGKAELFFAQPFNLESIDPRKKARVGFEFGLPGYLAPIADFEYAFLRQLSAHAGIRGRYGGISFEPGVKFAMLKSARTNTLLTVLADARVNLNPAYVGFRPQLGFGQRIRINEETFIDAQLQGGTELVTYGIFSPRIVGGANVSVAPGDTVRFYFETSTYMKDLGWDQGGSFRFNVVGFGVKFLERGKTQSGSRFEAGGGAIAPYSSNYWAFHSGAVGLDFNYYLP